MKKKIGFLVLVIAFVMTGVATYYFNSEENEMSENKTPQIVSLTPVKQLRKRERDKLSMVNNSRSKMFVQQLEGNLEQENIDPEERALQEKKSKVFWSNAPGMLDEMMLEEIVDEQWSATARSAIHDLLGAKEYSTSALVAVDCRESLCKAVLSHENVELGTDFRNGTYTEEPWAQGNLGGPLEMEGGQVGSYLFFTKEGDNTPFVEMEQLIASKQNEIFD